MPECLVLALLAMFTIIDDFVKLVCYPLSIVFSLLVNVVYSWIISRTEEVWVKFFFLTSLQCLLLLTAPLPDKFTHKFIKPLKITMSNLVLLLIFPSFHQITFNRHKYFVQILPLQYYFLPINFTEKLFLTFDIAFLVKLFSLFLSLEFFTLTIYKNDCVQVWFLL